MHNQEQHSIKNLADAKEFYLSMGCTSFYMCREYPDRYAEYKALNISRKTENAWRKEKTDSLYKSIKNSKEEYIDTTMFSYLELLDMTYRNVKKAYRLINRKFTELSPLYKIVIAEKICGVSNMFDPCCLSVATRYSKILQIKYLKLVKRMCVFACQQDPSLYERSEAIFNSKRLEKHLGELHEIVDMMEETVKEAQTKKS